MLPVVGNGTVNVRRHKLIRFFTQAHLWCYNVFTRRGLHQKYRVASLLALPRTLLGQAGRIEVGESKPWNLPIRRRRVHWSVEELHLSGPTSAVPEARNQVLSHARCWRLCWLDYSSDIRRIYNWCGKPFDVWLFFMSDLNHMFIKRLMLLAWLEPRGYVCIFVLRLSFSHPKCTMQMQTKSGKQIECLISPISNASVCLWLLCHRVRLHAWEV